LDVEREQALWNSIYTGLIGYLTVALFFLILDPLLGRGFLYTPALLGSTLFYSLTEPAALTIRPAPIIAYNVVHLVVLIMVGLVVGQLTYLAVRLGRQAWYLVTVLVILVLGHLYVALWALTAGVRSALPVWMITVAGLLAVVTMAVYLLMIYPELRRELMKRDTG